MTEQVKFKPGALVQTPFGPALLAPGEVVDAAHVSAGKMGVVYLRRTPQGLRGRASASCRRCRPVRSGRLKAGGSAAPLARFRVVTVSGGGTWQGYTCSVTTLLELAPDKPKELVTVPLYYDDAGAVAEGKRATTHQRQDRADRPRQIVRRRLFGLASISPNVTSGAAIPTCLRAAARARWTHADHIRRPERA